MHFGETDGFATLFTLTTEPSIISRVIEAQRQDVEAKTVCDRIARGVEPIDWVLHSDQGLRYKSKFTIGSKFLYFVFGLPCLPVVPRLLPVVTCRNVL